MKRTIMGILIGGLMVFSGVRAAEGCSTLKAREILTKAVMNMKDLKAGGATERQMLEVVAKEELPAGLKAALYEGVSYVYAPAEHSISLIVQAMRFACEDAAQ